MLIFTKLHGVCDERCYDAKEPKCTCVCGGVNHQVGYEQAVENGLAQAKKDKEVKLGKKMLRMARLGNKNNKPAASVAIVPKALAVAASDSNTTTVVSETLVGTDHRLALPLDEPNGNSSDDNGNSRQSGTQRRGIVIRSWRINNGE